jgi:site-specific DNA-methyltransferase (adenine-specific)
VGTSTYSGTAEGGQQVAAPWVELIEGDCLEELALLGRDAVQLVLTDIPYGEVDQVSSGLRKLDRGAADRIDFPLAALVDDLIRVCSGSFYVFCGTEQISPLVTRFKSWGLTTRVGVWAKTNPSPMNGTRLWLSGLEFCVFASKPNAVFNEHCQKALWDASSGRSKLHPTEKPLKLMERLVLASSRAGNTVLDCCAGSGTTGIAARNTGRNAILIERDPAYYAVAERRLWPEEVLA